MVQVTKLRNTYVPNFKKYIQVWVMHFLLEIQKLRKWYIMLIPANVTKIIVNESEGKKPEQYVIKNFNLNFEEMVATTPLQY